MRPSGAEAMWWVSLPSLLNEEWKLGAEAQFWVVSSSPTGAAGSLQSTSTPPPPHFNSSWCRWSGPWGQASPVSLACSAGTKRQVWKLACDSFFSDFERQLIVLVTVFTTDRWFSTKKKKKKVKQLQRKAWSLAGWQNPNVYEVFYVRLGALRVFRAFFNSGWPLCLKKKKNQRFAVVCLLSGGHIWKFVGFLHLQISSSLAFESVCSLSRVLQRFLWISFKYF